MRTIKGPAIFLAQFAGDTAPFDTLDNICSWAAGLGYKGVQIPTWVSSFIDLEKAATSKTYADELKGIVAEPWPRDHRAVDAICRASWSRCIRPMTRCSTALRPRRCTAIPRRGRNGRSST